jgi:transcriptional regulator with XRE-family HTH domain
MSTSPESLLEEVPIPTPGRAESSPASLTEARACVDWIVLAILHLNRRVGFELQTAVLIHDLVLAGASQAAMFWRHGLADQARHSLVHAWIDQSLVFEPGWKYLHDFRNEMVQGVFDADTTKLQASDLDREFLLVFTVAVSEKLVAEGAELYARQSLRHIMARLELPQEDVARMLAVSGDTIADWEAGRTAIPVEARTAISRANAAVTRLLGIFRPERLPQVIRRTADIFDGQSALDWILFGRVDEVANRYEAAFAYQG